MESTVESWPSEKRKEMADEVSDLLSAKAAAIQKDAVAAHERGEDVSDAAATLQTIVDLCVQVKLVQRKLDGAPGASADESSM